MRRRQGTQALRIANQPGYVAVAFLDKLERKLENERGRPEPARDEPPAVSADIEDEQDSRDEKKSADAREDSKSGNK